MHVIPNDQISDFPSYWPSSMARITSGAIQYGVPTNDLAGDAMEAEPKSAERYNFMEMNLRTKRQICKTDEFQN